jgi:hypothetical protein
VGEAFLCRAAENPYPFLTPAAKPVRRIRVQERMMLFADLIR